FNHAHTGEGTKIIKNAGELSELARLFPNRPARVSQYIDGPVFTLNAVVTEKETSCGNISYQITGLSQFTDNPFSTIGNDWALPHKILSEKEREEIRGIAQACGARMKKDGWQGLFGIDLIYDTKNKKIFLLEINARQPASTTCESILQKMSGTDKTIFESHISSLLGLQATSYKLQAIKNGAQILMRKKSNQRIDIKKARAKLESAGFSVIPYENEVLNKELLRIRSDKGIMKSHEKLNSVGEAIASLIS
ncbi:MAG TPA: ATP-grasp domain-containing protein, partial [Candidatus Paceibacterota bacterium]|nr:ATP-grasp domain-containing protein [Candidatus Paceibacterota bacterium]